MLRSLSVVFSCDLSSLRASHSPACCENSLHRNTRKDTNTDGGHRAQRPRCTRDQQDARRCRQREYSAPHWLLVVRQSDFIYLFFLVGLMMVVNIWYYFCCFFWVVFLNDTNHIPSKSMSGLLWALDDTVTFSWTLVLTTFSVCSLSLCFSFFVFFPNSISPCFYFLFFLWRCRLSFGHFI